MIEQELPVGKDGPEQVFQNGLEVLDSTNQTRPVSGLGGAASVTVSGDGRYVYVGYESVPRAVVMVPVKYRKHWQEPGRGHAYGHYKEARKDKGSGHGHGRGHGHGN